MEISFSPVIPEKVLKFSEIYSSFLSNTPNFIALQLSHLVYSCNINIALKDFNQENLLKFQAQSSRYL